MIGNLSFPRKRESRNVSENQMLMGLTFHKKKALLPLEVVSKFQIRFKGPAKRDYMSNLRKIKVCIKRQA